MKQEIQSSSAERIRESVSKAYRSAVESSRGESSDGTSCCGESCCGGSAASKTATATTTPVEQKGVAVKSAGYERSELDALPADAVENSFGCGNPLAFADVKEGDVVLDLGSGAGIDLLIAAKKVGATGRVIGVDMTDAMIEHARENVARAGVNTVEVRKGLIEDLPVKSGTVDWVISNCVINLSPEKDRVFAEIARVLKPCGRISISDIVVENLPESIRTDERMYCSCIGGAISESAYASGLQLAGISNVKVVDRIVYDASQLAGLIESELPKDAIASCCKAEEGGQTVHSMAQAAAGSIQSVRFTGQKL